MQARAVPWRSKPSQVNIKVMTNSLFDLVASCLYEALVEAGSSIFSQLWQNEVKHVLSPARNDDFTTYKLHVVCPGCT
jgi:hypothetical protein